MRRVVLTGAVAIALALTSSASASAQSASEDAGLAARRQIARDIVKENASTMETLVKQMLAQVSGMMRDSFKNHPNVGEKMARFGDAELLKMVPQLLENSAEAYAQHLTEAELRDMLAWNQSASGRSIMAKMPAISAEIVARQQPALLELRSKAARFAARAVCEDMGCTSAELKELLDTIDRSSQARYERTSGRSDALRIRGLFGSNPPVASPF